VIREIGPFSKPKIPAGPLEMKQMEIAQLINDEDGSYHDIPASFSQHNAYPYYVAFLKEYFFRDYKELNLVYLPEVIEKALFANATAAEVSARDKENKD